MIWWLNGLSSLIRRLLMGMLLSVLLLLFLLPELDLFSVDFFSEWAGVTAVVFSKSKKYPTFIDQVVNDC